MPSPNELTWVRMPVQARSAATLTRLLDATEKLLNQKPFDDITVHEICRVARSSVGAFYVRFPDKLGLLHVLHERLCAEADATVEDVLTPTRWEGVPMADIIDAMVGFMVHEYRQRLGLRRELVRRNGIDSLFQARSVAVAARAVRGLTHLLQARQAELAIVDVMLAADTVHRVVFAVLDQAASYPHAAVADLPITDEGLAAELSHTVWAYLTVPHRHS